VTNASLGEFIPNGHGGKSLHRQVAVAVGDRSADVDARIAPLVAELWRADIGTCMSCERHTATGKIWLAFETAEDAERFLALVVVGSDFSEWSRSEQWYFGQYEPSATLLPAGGHPAHPKGWEFHTTISDDSLRPDAEGDGTPRFRVGVSVLIPRRDYRRVLSAVTAVTGGARG
jgi:hypothetical protein